MKIQAWGNSAAVRLPAVLLSKLDMRVGQEISAVVVDGALVLKPVKKPKYTLNELIAQCDPQAERDADVVAWQDMESVGKEAW
jgi:antitoxin ChpS